MYFQTGADSWARLRVLAVAGVWESYRRECECCSTSSGSCSPGFWIAIGYAIAALFMFILIITIPFGVAALRIGIFALWPFGKTVVRREDAGAGSAIGNVIWFVLAGWWLIILHIVTGVLLCLTIIGIPLGLANFKLIPVTFRPFGRDIVSIEEAERQGLEQHAAVPG